MLAWAGTRYVISSCSPASYHSRMRYKKRIKRKKGSGLLFLASAIFFHNLAHFCGSRWGQEAPFLERGYLPVFLWYCCSSPLGLRPWPYAHQLRQRLSTGCSQPKELSSTHWSDGTKSRFLRSCSHKCLIAGSFILTVQFTKVYLTSTETAL